MRNILLLAMVCLITPLWAQENEVTHWTNEEIGSLPESLNGLLEEALKTAPARGSISHRLMDPSEDRNRYVLVLHRIKSGQAESHDEKTDIYIVLSGEATLHVGGTIPNRSELSNLSGEWRGPLIQGGKKIKLSVGDMVDIPAGIPHRVILEEGKKITYVVVKIIGKNE